MTEQQDSIGKPVMLDVRTDGTAFDEATGLVWMLPFLGQGWVSGSPTGQAAKLPWAEASSRFGRARNLEANELDCHWRGERARSHPLSQASYQGYESGNENWSFAGKDDWRLPTVEEYWALSETEYGGTPLDARQVDVVRMQTWTANSSTNSLKGFFAALLGMGPCAWMFELFPGDEYSNGFGDMKKGFSYPIRLVRSGHLWKALRR